MVKNPLANAGDTGDMSWIPGLGRSSGGGHGKPLQYSCLENPMDRGARWATVHRVTKSWTWLSNYACSHATLKWFALILHPAFKPDWLKWFLNYKRNLTRKTYTANSAGRSHRRHTRCPWGRGESCHFHCPAHFFNSQSQDETANRAG